MPCQTPVRTQMRPSSFHALARSFVVRRAPRSGNPDRREKEPIDSMPRDEGRAPCVTPLPLCPIHVPRAIFRLATTAMPNRLGACGCSAMTASMRPLASCAQSHTVLKRLSLMHIRGRSPTKMRLSCCLLHQRCNRSHDVLYRRLRLHMSQWGNLIRFRLCHLFSLRPHCLH